MVHDKDTTFVRRDVEMLSEEFDVDVHHFVAQPKIRAVWSMISLSLKLIFHPATWRVVLCQSAGYLSFPPALLARVLPFKTAIIAIGTDCSRLPEIGYGHFTKIPLRWFTRWSYQSADLILPVHKSLEKDDYRYDEISYPKQGFANFIPRLKTPVTEIVNGYRHRQFTLDVPSSERPVSFLTVAARLNKAAYLRKGIDLMLAVARRFPDLPFTIVSEFERFDPVPPNVTVHENVPQAELVSIYNAHKFYLQLSMFEGFPNALCEAMLCGCVPIGSDVAGIPDIIGTEGYLLHRRDVDALTRLIGQAVSNVAANAFTPRQRILDNFPIERRAKELGQALNLLMDSQPKHD